MSLQQEADPLRPTVGWAGTVSLFLLVLVPSTPALAAQVLTPSAAEKIPALVAGTPLPAGAAFSSIRVDGGEATLVLTKGSPPKTLGRLVLTPANTLSWSSQSRSFHIEIQVVKDSPEVRAALEAARARIMERDPGNLYTEVFQHTVHHRPRRDSARSRRRTRAELRHAWLSRTLTAFALLAGAGVWVVRRSARA